MKKAGSRTVKRNKYVRVIQDFMVKGNRPLLLGICLFAMIAASPCQAAADFEVVTERNVPAKMRDGVVLRADIYRPKAEGKFPVLLVRTPYNKDSTRETGLRGARRGYVIIYQDCRGRYASEGEWYPFRDESQDGFDTVEWAAALPYSNGKVGFFSGSYCGATQLLAAIAQPPHLAGLSASLTAANYHDGWVYQGGAFEQWFNETWTSGWLVVDTLNHHIRKNANTSQWAWKLPMASYPLLDSGPIESLAPYFGDWLDHPNYDSYWKQWSIEDNYDKILVPAYHVGGWYDIFLGGTLRNYLGIKSRGGSETARGNQRLLIGPWGHAGVGEIDFGPAARLDYDEWLMFRWYDHLLKGVDNGIDREKPVKIFVMGRNIWREEEDWPLARARSTPYYLHSAGRANCLRGDGALSSFAPHQEPVDNYVYDPADPVPSRGGGLCCGGAFPSGVFDQRVAEARDDVLVYSTPPFQEDVEVTGPVGLVLYASASTVDTDFTAKVVDVSPDGLARNLTDGILRGRYRNSQEHPELMNPGEAYQLAIDLGATSNVFLAGHRLRLEVSSSNFPRFDRNLNTGEDQGHSVRSVKAKISIYHDAKHPSALVLPVVPK